MKEKQKLIEAFKALDFEALHSLLDDNRSYMDVSKELFLSKLKQTLQKHKKLKCYENVVEGTCNHCNKGSKAYKFKAINFPSLPLYFEEKDDEVTDIYLCNAFMEDNTGVNDWNIYLRFYEDEKVDFKPSIEHLITLQRVEKAVEDFNKLKKIGLVPIEEVVHWYNKCELLAIKLEIDDPIIEIKYKSYEHIYSIYNKVSHLVHNYENNHLAKKALETFNKINKDDEKSIVRWLLDNKYNNYYMLKVTDNWRKTGFLILETNPNLIVDCTGYFEGFFLKKLYSNQLNKIMKKYEPTAEHFDQNKGGIEYSLKSHLKIHNKYLDLLDEIPDSLDL